jgi:pyruvate/2-oxoglutarate dehydrogenase complex dihydrolipoamide dehydrogenase (E3) component
MCEAFRRLDLKTTLVYRGELPMHRIGNEFAQQILQELEGNGVAFMGNTKLEGFEQASNQGIAVHTSNDSLEADLVLLGVGVVPAVALASEAGLALGTTGAIAVDEQMQTSAPSIFAAGDCCESHHRISRLRKNAGQGGNPGVSRGFRSHMSAESAFRALLLSGSSSVSRSTRAG